MLWKHISYTSQTADTAPRCDFPADGNNPLRSCRQVLPCRCAAEPVPYTRHPQPRGETAVPSASPDAAPQWQSPVPCPLFSDRIADDITSERRKNTPARGLDCPDRNTPDCAAAPSDPDPPRYRNGNPRRTRQRTPASHPPAVVRFSPALPFGCRSVAASSRASDEKPPDGSAPKTGR